MSRKSSEAEMFSDDELADIKYVPWYSRKAFRFIGKVLGSDQFGGPRTKTRDEEHESDQEVLALR